jgi:peptidoglycan/xylan/chitin deacetylase (PgdA/CDA1 family)/glycosyltransferase involved in cell wall biosynthesis
MVSPNGIAVVVTCHDLGRTLEDAIHSVRRQTRAPSEIVVVDDGSEDLYTREVLVRLEAGGVRVLRAPRRGPSAARNTGISQTSSPYVVLLDGDDLLEPAYFERAAGMLDGDPALAFVSCGMTSFGASAETWFPAAPEIVVSLATGVVHISSMFRREVWKAVGGFDEGFVGYEDVDFWTSVLEHGYRGLVLPEPLLQYRVRPGSMNQAAMQHHRHLHLMRRFYRKHWSTVTAHAERLLIEKERFLTDQRAHLEQLQKRADELDRTRAEVESEIDAVVHALQMEARDRVELGDLRRTSPLSPCWGLDRGLPVDRWYIESFLDRHRGDIRGRVLEVKDAGYTRRFGDDRVAASEVLDIEETNPHAHLIADLTQIDAFDGERYDCVILTQTLGLIHDVSAALATVRHILKPSGVLLCTAPAAGRISYEPPGLDGDHWRFTEASLRRLFAAQFPAGDFTITGFGNVLAGAAFLYGLAAHELTEQELETHDAFFPLVYGVRAVKVERESARHQREVARAAILMYHRVADVGAPPGLTVSPSTFRAHLQHLRDGGFEVAPLSDLVRGARLGKLPPTTVALTFDDGYLDVLTNAAGSLAEFGYPATFFIVGRTLTGRFEFWWDALARVFLSDRALPSHLRVALNGATTDLAISTVAERRMAHDRLAEACYTLPLPARDALVQRILHWAEASDPQGDEPRAMTADEVLQIAAYPGAELGAHGDHHVWLPTQPPDIQLREVVASRTRLEELLGCRVKSFAYPYGGYDAATVEVVRRAGFDYAVTTDDGLVSAPVDSLRLPRLEIRNWDRQAFAARLSRAWR